MRQCKTSESLKGFASAIWRQQLDYFCKRSQAKDELKHLVNGQKPKSQRFFVSKLETNTKKEVESDDFTCNKTSIEDKEMT